MNTQLRANLLSLIDRRTIVTVIVVSLLFILAWRGVGVAEAIDGMVFVCVALVGANSAQKSLVAWATYKKGGKNGLRKQEKEIETSEET